MDHGFGRRRSCPISQPASKFRILRGFVIDHVEAGTGLTITGRPVAALARCPGCDQPSSRIHSRSTRTRSDLPVAARRVVIDVRVRGFRCIEADCRTKIFAERLKPDLAADYGQRPARLDCIVHHLALGSRPTASFAQRLLVPASRDTLLQTLRRRGVRPVEHPHVIGIDGWAFRRGQRYGTLVCDPERRRVIALRPDRQSGAVETWLAAIPRSPSSPVTVGVATVRRRRERCSIPFMSPTDGTWRLRRERRPRPRRQPPVHLSGIELRGGRWSSRFAGQVGNARTRTY